MHLLVLLLSLSFVQSQSNNQNTAQQDVIKTKRGITLLPTAAFIGNPSYKPSLFYPDTAPSASAATYTNPKTLYSIQQSTQIRPILVPEPPKPFQYDQYPPHNQRESQPSLSETTQPQVIFNQPHHRLNNFVNNPANLQPQPNQYQSAQSVVNPIHHSTYIHHTPYMIPGGSPQSRYYVGGGQMYNQKYPLQQHKVQQSGPSQSQERVQLPQKTHKPQQYQQNLNNVAPIQFEPQITHHGYHEKPKPQREDKKEEEQQAAAEEEEEEEAETGKQQEAAEDDEEGAEEKEELKEDEDGNEEVEEDDERPARYNNEEQQEEEEEDEEPNKFSKYQALDEPEHEKYEEEAEEDEDNDRESNYHVPKNKNKNQKYHSKAPKYEFYDGFHYKPRVIKTKPAKPLRSYSTKIESKFGGYQSNNHPKQKKLDSNSKQSENVPVAVHKIYKEKWYIAKENIK